MRILGLDYGSKTVGVAISDPLGITAQGVETIWRKQENHLRQTLARIEELVSEYHVEKIVLGYPKNMNNTSSFRFAVAWSYFFFAAISRLSAMEKRRKPGFFMILFLFFFL